MGETGLAFQEKFAERVYRHAQTDRTACFMVRGSGDTTVCVAPGVVQPNRLSHSRNAGKLAVSHTVNMGQGEKNFPH